MIQRIQTVYLALVFIIMAVMSFLPVVMFSAGDAVFYMSVFKFEGVDSLSFASQLPNIWPLPILVALLAIISGLNIFRYSNRSQQMKLNMLALIFNFGLLVAIFLYADEVSKLTEVSEIITYDVAAYFPVVTVLLLILANRNIRKDDKLVKESERLR